MHGHMSEFSCCRSWGAAEAMSHANGWKAFPLPGAPRRWSRDRKFDVEHLRIDVALDFEQGTIRGTVTHRIRPFLDDLTEVELDCAELEVSRVTADGARCRFVLENAKLRATLPAAARKGKPLEIAVEYSGSPRRGLYFITPSEERPDRVVHAWTQGQDEDSHYWFPCFDYPNEKQTTEVVATVPEGFQVLSNGSLVKRTRDARGATETWHWRLDVPHVAYLVTLVAGRFEIFETKWRDVPVTYWSLPGMMSDVRRTLGRTPRMMTHFSKRTGVPYPYPQYAQVFVQDFIFGGMENTSATTLTDTAIVTREAAREYWMDGLVAHELAHQWFGDWVTCRDWSHGWLNEGFATYMETVWKRELDGLDEEAYYRVGEQAAYLDEDGRQYRRPIVCNDYHDPIEVFDRHLYQKGACVLHMLAEELGDELFWECIRRYLERHARGSVMTEDLRRVIEDVTGRNLEWFFDQWVFHGGHPELEVKAQERRGQLLLRVAQKQTVDAMTPLFRFKVAVRAETDEGSVEQTFEVDQAAQTLVLDLPGRLKWVALDAGAHLLWSGKVDQPPEAWAAALAGDRDGVTRVRAARALVEDAKPAGVRALGTALRGDALWFVRAEAARALGSIHSQAARDELIQAVGDGDPRVRRTVASALGGWRGDAKAAEALIGLLGRQEHSPGVLHDAAQALGRTRVDAALDRLLEHRKRPVWNELAWRGALVGLGELADDRALSEVLADTRPDRSEAVRSAAAVALAKLGLDRDSDREKVRLRLEDLVTSGQLRAQLTAALVLTDRREEKSVGVLRAQAACDLDGRVRRSCKLAAQAITTGRDRGDDLRKLREELEKLREEHRKTVDRLERVEHAPTPRKRRAK